MNAPVWAYFEALNRKDLEGVLDVFTDDAVLMPSEAETAIGGDQIRATYEQAFTILGFDRELHIDESMGEGDLAVVRCHTTGSLTFLASGHPIPGVFREIFVLQRFDGRWKIRCYMNNSPKPPEQR